MDENLANWYASSQRAGKWFSTSLALGIDVAVNRINKLFADELCTEIVFLPEFLLLTLYRVVYQGIHDQFPGPQDPPFYRGPRVVHWHIPCSNSFLPT